MAAGAPPDLYPLPNHHSGLFSKVLTVDRLVDDKAWRHHLHTLQHVGKCRRCTNPLRALTPYPIGAVTWYPAECTSPTCTYETSMRGPAPQKKG